MPPEINNTIEDINTTVSEINTGGGRNLPQLTPIAPEDVATPSGDMTLPESAPEQDVSGELAAMENMPDEFVAGLEADTAAAAQAQTTSLDQYLNDLLTSPGETEATTQAYADEGVNQFKRELLDINDQMRREQLSARRRVERVKENMEGRSARAINNEVRRVENESYQKQADLAIIQMARQGRYDSAKEIADRQVAVQMEQQERVLQARQLIYQNNKDLFTTAEQREFETKQNDRQMKLQAEKEQKQLLQQIKLDALKMAQTNGAPSEVLRSIQSSSSPEEVLERGGQWGSVDMLERQYRRQQIATSRTNQLLNLAAAGDPSAIAELGFDPAEKPEELDPTTKRKAEEQVDATGDLLRLATEYKSLIDTKGFTNEIFGNQGTIGDIQSIRSQMTALYKDAKTLGTLDQGLLTLMDGILGEKPTSSIFGIGEESNILGNLGGRKSQRISASMQQLIDQTSIENARASHKLGRKPWSNPLDLDLPEDSSVKTNQTSSDPLGIN